MKKLYLLLPLIFSFAILSCPKEPEPEPEPPPTLDQRLVGGRWYFPKNYTSFYGNSLKSDPDYGYYQFTDDGKLIYTKETSYFKNGSNVMSGKEVYSKDGIVYWKDTNEKVIQYSFPSEFPYRRGSTVFLATSSEYSTLDFLASKGDLITYRIYKFDGSIYNDTYPQKEFLVRFKEDGTQYNYYE